MDTFEVIDEGTAAMILQLQISDSIELYEDLENRSKQPEGEVSDAQLALQIYIEDLQRNASIFADRQMTKSIARACQTDGAVLTVALTREQAAASDREVACRLGGVEVNAPVQPWTVGAEFFDDEMLAKLNALYVSTPDEGIEYKIKDEDEDDWEDEDGDDDYFINNGDNHGESSEWAASRTITTISSRVQCVACQEVFRFCDTARAPCGDEYCRECLRNLFRTSLTDDSLFPPKCCKQYIPLSTVRIHLTGDLVRQYEAKKIEYETVNRTYCSNVHCSAFIQAEHIEHEKATCPVCRDVTCTMCKAEEHTGDCPADTALQLVLDTANENGWQRCYGCHRLVELDIGCNHITCPCGSEFCYICARQWKTCQCEQWNEDRLLARANQVVARQPVRADVPERRERAAAQVAERVAAAVENLRTGHNCDHEQWRYVRGQAQCEECYHTLPSYIFECQQCNIQACNRCRRNRL